MNFSKPVPRILLALLIFGGGYWLYAKFNDNPSVQQVMKTVLPSEKGINSPTGKVFTPAANKDTINVCVVTWGGYAGGQYFNEGFEASKESRFYRDYGISVAFKVIEDYDASRKAWAADECQLLWTTADSFPIEAATQAVHSPQILFQSDWSRKGDAMVVSREINTVADLKGKRVGFLPGSPSHTFLLWMLEAGGLDYTDIVPVTAPSAPDAAAYFKAGKTDASVVWSPDDEDAVASRKGSRVFKSTGDAPFIIADVFYAKASYVQSHRKELRGLVEGWMRGNAEINSNPAARAKAVKLVSSGLKQPEDFVDKAISNVRLTTYGDNTNFFNLQGNYYGVKGEDLYLKMSRIYHIINLAPAEVPNWRSVTDVSFLKELSLVGPEHAAEGKAKYSAPTSSEVSASAFAVKRLTVTFPTGSATLDENAKALIDAKFGDILKGFNSRVRVEGNTDVTGNATQNRVLSKKRAESVVDYLASEYKVDRNRFIVVGNGSDKPVADNNTDSGRSKNRRTDFELLN